MFKYKKLSHLNVENWTEDGEGDPTCMIYVQKGHHASNVEMYGSLTILGFVWTFLNLTMVIFTILGSILNI